jgi:cyclase
VKRNYNITDQKNIFSSNDKKFWFEVFIYGGKKETGVDAIDWAKQVDGFGAGEILLTSIDMDGTKDGYDIILTKEIVNSVSIPVIASGGCGKPEDIITVFKETNVEAALAASIFHYETHSVDRVKKIIKENGISVRI